jgi:hypothetical protein
VKRRPRRLPGRTAPAANGCSAPTQTTPPRPYELIPGVAAALSSISLAEAQQLAAFRLEERKGAPSLSAALHVAAGELYDRAARELRGDGSERPRPGKGRDPPRV